MPQAWELHGRKPKPIFIDIAAQVYTAGKIN